VAACLRPECDVAKPVCIYFIHFSRELLPAPWILTIIELQTLGEKQLGVEALAQGQKGQRSFNTEHQEMGQPFVLFQMVEIRHDARWQQHQHRDAVDDRITRHLIDEGAYNKSQ
jgi:hypothetical protein